MTQKPSHYSTSRLVLSGLVVLAALAAACSTRIASNLTSPQAPDAASGAPGGSVTAAAADAGAAARGSQAVAAQERPLFDFQTERPAVPTGTVRPEYPAELRAAGIEGSVLVQIVVDANGIPEMATFRVLKSANEGFSASVRDALSRMTFTPAQAGGRTVRQLLQIPFGFELSKPTAEWVQGRPATAPVVSGAPRGAVAPARPAAPTSSTAPFFDFQVEKPAQVRPGVTPTYPAELRARGVEGSVLVQFVVNEDGTIDGTTVRILRSTGDAFSDAVREALPTMQYTPAETAGRKVKQLVQQRFGFAPDSR